MELFLKHSLAVLPSRLSLQFDTLRRLDIPAMSNAVLGGL